MSLSPQSAQWLPVGVRVSVLRARGLRIKGKDGTNDAYVALQAGRETFRTPVAERLAEPVWGEESGALVFTTTPDGAALQVRVMHRVPLGADKLLGLSVINLQELRSNLTENPQWFKLLNKAGKADKERGEVQLDVQFLKSSMSVSMIDLSDKSHSRFGKFKDKLRGKHKDSLGDSASAILPPTSQVLTDSEEEAEPQGEGETPKKKKNKLKSLFVPKSNLQRNVSQSMSALGTLPDRNSSISSSTFSGLNLEPSEGKGKKKFKFLTHKRNSSTDSKTSSQSNLFLSSTNQSATSQVGVCVNGSHVYSGEPEPLDVEEEEEDENWRQDEEAIEQIEGEKRRMERETEMRRKMEEEEKERTWRMAEEKRMEEDRIRIQKIKEEQLRMMEEEKKRTEEREAEEQRRKLEEDRKRRMAEQERIERERMEEEKIRIEREKAEQIKRIQEDNERRIKMEREEEQKLKEERQRREEEIQKLAEEREMIEKQKRKSEEEERERIRVEKEERERRRKMEEKERERIRIEQEETQKLEKEKERIMEEQRKESEERKRQEDERERKRIEEMEEERIKAEKEQERKRRMDEEENRMIEERKRAEKRLQDVEERRKAKEEEQRQKEEDERMQVEKRRQEEKEQERKRRIEEENRIKEERIKIEKEQRQKEEDERMRVEEERKMEELRRKKEKQRDEEEKKEKEENMSRSARISAKPSVSVTVIDSRSSVVNSNPFLDDSDSSSSETVTDRTSKKGRAPLPPQKIPLVPNPDESLRDNTMSEETKQSSKRPAPQPRVRLMVTKDESLNKKTMEHTNPFTCDVPGTAEYKIKLAPKPEAVSSAFGDGLLNFAANQKEASCISEEPGTSYEGNTKEDMMTDWNPLGRSKQPSTSTTIQLQTEPSDLFQIEETLKNKVLPDAVISNPSSSLLSEPKSTSGGVLNMEPFHKKSRAPLPPKDPKNLTQSSFPECNAITSESSSVQKSHDNNNNQNLNLETPASGGAHSLKSSLFAQSQVMQPSVSVEATDTGSGSALKSLPCAKVAPGGGSEVMIHSSSVIRQQAVRPLNSEPEAHDTRSSQLSHHIPKAAEALNKGPYAQLTQPELISLALRQQEQISQRDGRIQQLEQYIDDLLVKVIEEKPSILMHLNNKNKST